MICVESVTINASNIVLKVGAWYTGAYATVCPENASCTSVTWHSGNTNIATVNPYTGYVYGKAAGTVKVYATATDGSACSDHYIITVVAVYAEGIVVCPETLSMKTGENYCLEATVYPTNTTNKAIAWSSGDCNIADVDSNGCVIAKAAGTTYICAEAQDGSEVCGCCSVTVKNPILVEGIDVSPDTLTLIIGETATLSAEVSPSNADNKTIRWTSDDCNIADVDSVTGFVTAKAAGTTYIYAEAQDGSGVSGCCEVTVTDVDNEDTNNTENAVQSFLISPSVKKMYINTVEKLTAVIFPSNDTNQSVTWHSSNSNIVSVDDGGTLWAKAVGNVTITAKTDDGKYAATATITVSNTNYYNIVNKSSGKMVDFNGKLDNRPSVYQYRRTGGDKQVWRIDNVSKTNSYIKAYIDDSYGFNIYTLSNNCDLIKTSGNEKDAAVCFISQNDGYYKIKLKNYDYYLTSQGTANNSNICWAASSENDLQVWKLVGVDLTRHEAEKEEFHIISQAGGGNALLVYGYVNVRLSSDTELRTAKLSYRNMQKWTIRGVDTAKKIYTQHGDGFALCNNGSNVAMVSANLTDENSNITLVPYGSDENTYEIKLSNSALYLTFSNDGSITWKNYNDVNHINQVWSIVTKPSNFHNGCDTSTQLTATTAKTLRLSNKEFVCRYYKPNESNPKALTLDEVNYLHNEKLKIVSVYQNVGTSASNFSETSGVSDATLALARASEIGQPEGTAIYFAVDYDPDGELTCIEEYFGAVKNTINGKYKVGVYGRSEVCNHIKQNLKYATFSWLSPSSSSTGFPDYDTNLKYNIKQAECNSYNGIAFDDDTAIGDDYGQW